MPDQGKREKAWQSFWQHGLSGDVNANGDSGVCAAISSLNTPASNVRPAVGSYAPLPFRELSQMLVALRSLRWPVSLRRYVPGGGFCVGASQNAHGATFNPPASVF